MPNQYYVLKNFTELTEINLFHLLNIANERKVFLILLDTKEPNFLLPDLISRLNNLNKQVISLPSKNSLQSILLSNLSDKQIVLSENIVNYLLKNLTSYQDLYVLLKKLEFFYEENNKKISLAEAKRLAG